MSDALVSPAVAGAGAATAAVLLAVAATRVRRGPRPVSMAMMGVMGAFVFAAQMLNFAIPGTGSSGHVVGGVLLAAILGPWAAFLTLSAVIVIQCLVFADGGLLALGCNIVNMAAMTCLVAYPLIFKPIVTASAHRSPWRTCAAAIAACVVGLECGALLVTVETTVSGVTLLPTGQFLWFMLPIHLAIGLCEGVATGALLVFVTRTRPDILAYASPSGNDSRRRHLGAVAALIGAVVIVTAMFAGAWASDDPDGLEWSMLQVAGTDELPAAGVVHKQAADLQSKTAGMPDYDNRFAGVAGAAMCVVAAGALCAVLKRRHHKKDA